MVTILKQLLQSRPCAAIILRLSPTSARHYIAEVRDGETGFGRAANVDLAVALAWVSLERAELAAALESRAKSLRADAPPPGEAFIAAPPGADTVPPVALDAE